MKIGAKTTLPACVDGVADIIVPLHSCLLITLLMPVNQTLKLNLNV